MYSDDIRAKLNEIADLATDNEFATLIRQLGELMYARLTHTTENNEAVQIAIEALGKAFLDLDVRLQARLLTSEQAETKRVAAIIDRVHHLANRFMSVEEKVNQTLELLDLRLSEILGIIQSSGDGK